MNIKSKRNSRGSEISVRQSGNRDASVYILSNRNTRLNQEGIQNCRRMEIEKKMIYGLKKTWSSARERNQKN